MTRYQGWILYIFALVGGITILVAVSAVLIVVWATIRGVVRHRRARLAQESQEQAKYGPDGNPYPPAALGLCDSCSRSDEHVYHLESGQRLCPACYEEFLSA